MELTPNIVVFDDGDALAAGAADRIADFVNQRAASTVTIGMAGGSTPTATYRELRQLPVRWDKVYAWVGDERFVPPDHPDNNGAMIRRELIDHTEATLFPVPWDAASSPEQIAAEYETTLLQAFEHDTGGPRPHLLLAGIGDDGHTLSLFPETKALDVTDRWFVANEVPQKDTWRLTATYPLAHRAIETIVLVSGAGKQDALRRIMDATINPPLPARRLMAGTNQVTWLVDRAAAQGLSTIEQEGPS